MNIASGYGIFRMIDPYQFDMPVRLGYCAMTPSCIGLMRSTYEEAVSDLKYLINAMDESKPKPKPKPKLPILDCSGLGF